MTQRIRLGRMHHASIRIQDLERSRAFYEGLLGMEALERPDLGFPGKWYGVGDAELHLIQSPGFDGPIDPTDPHFAVEVDDFEATRSTLEAQGIRFLELGDAMWIRDPDGNVVELRRAQT